MRRSKVQKLGLSLALLLIVGSLTTLVGALKREKSYYDDRAYNWVEKGPWDEGYNCLAYALGTKSSWIWPWGPDPSQSQVDLDMKRLYGLDRVSPWHNDSPVVGVPRIIAYSVEGKVKHFASANTWGYASNTAKWGGLELMGHTTRNPYKTLINYGYAYGYYSVNP